MREIKFRAWLNHGNEKEMLYDINNGDCLVWKNQGQAIEHVMQYTGLKDKNGKEIYEGDILRYKHYYAIKRWWRNSSEIQEIEEAVQKQREGYAIEHQHIVFADGGFYLGYNISGRDIRNGELFKKGSGNRNDYEERYWDFEVVGNIYENKELLGHDYL